MGDKYFSTTEAAKICQVTPGSVIRWIKDGRLDTARTAGGHRRIPATSLLKLIKQLGLSLPKELSELARQSGESLYKVLVVDDDIAIRKMISWALKEMLPEVRIEQAQDGFVAGWKARGFCPDLVILDIRMPGMDGFRFCEFVRELPELKSMRILAMSGIKGFDYEQKILKAGAHDFLVKPFGIDELKAKIARQLTIAEAGSENP